jgi:hypothetical protein
MDHCSLIVLLITATALIFTFAALLSFALTRI